MSPDKLPRGVIEIILDAASDLIVLHDLDGTVFFVNEAVRQFLGEVPGGILGRPFAEFLAPELSGLWAAKKTEISLSGSLRFDAQGFRADGSRADLDVRSKSLRVEGRLLVLSVARDVTDEKVLAHELGTRVADLEEFYRMAADRELAMIALKKENRILRARLADDGDAGAEA